MRDHLLKFLRIAVTAVSLLVCGLMIVLWVRSYCRPGSVRASLFNSSVLISASSFAGVGDVRIEQPLVPGQYSWRFAGIEDYNVGKLLPNKRWKFLSTGLDWTNFRTPYWFYVTVFAAIAALPWIKWRFSLRTLLIVLTLFAVFFGVIAMSFWTVEA